MDKLASPQRQKLWLMLILVGGSLAIALPGHSGSVPTGLTSGVSVGGSNLLPIGGSTLGSEELVVSTSVNATVDPITGDITLTAAAQQALNTSANQIAQGLQGTNPVLATALTTPGEISLSSPSPVGASGVEEDGGGNETVDEIAAEAAAAIANGASVSLTSNQGTLGIAAPTIAVGAGQSTLVANRQALTLAQTSNSTDPILVTSAVFTPHGGTPVVAPLRGTLAQIASAAGFLAAAFATGLSPSQVAPFTEMALAGADYQDLVPLFNAVSGLIPPQSQTAAAAVDPTQLEDAIQAYNRIVDNSAPATLAILGQNSDFVALGRSLQQLRAAIELS